MSVAEATDVKVVSIKDVGPHTSCEIAVAPGITVLAGENQIGKSVAIRCVAALAGGDAKSLPVRDGAKCGVVSGLGTILTVSTRTQLVGDLEVETPSGSISMLVDPGLKDRAAATRKRIHELLTLTRTTIEWGDFLEVLPEEYRSEIDPDLADKDPVVMQGKIKRHLEKKARHFEEAAKSAGSKAESCLEQIRGVDVSKEPNEEQLRKSLQDAAAHKARVESRRDEHEKGMQARRQAEARLRVHQEHTKGPSVEDAEAQLESAKERKNLAAKSLQTAEKDLQEAQRHVAESRRRYEESDDTVVNAEALLEAARERESAIADLKELVESDMEAPPTDMQIRLAAERAELAESELVQASEIRRAIETKRKAEEHKAEQLRSERIAAVFRKGAKATDEILTRAVKSSVFRVEEGELKAEDRHGVWRPFDDLSDGARYTKAIVALAEHATGPITLATVDQVGFEGLDTRNKNLVRDTAIAHNVAIVTGEVSDGELRVYRYGE